MEEVMVPPRLRVQFKVALGTSNPMIAVSPGMVNYRHHRLVGTKA